MATGPAPRRSKRLKFRFEGEPEENDSVQNSRKVSSDDILESLQKQTGSGERLQESDELEEDVVLDEETEENIVDASVNPRLSPVLRKAILSKHRHSSHRFGFVILVFAALAIVGVYESMMRYSDPFYYARRISGLGLDGLFANSFELILISFTGIVALALLMRRHRNHLSKPPFSTRV